MPISLKKKGDTSQQVNNDTAPDIPDSQVKGAMRSLLNAFTHVLCYMTFFLFIVAVVSVVTDDPLIFLSQVWDVVLENELYFVPLFALLMIFGFEEIQRIFKLF